MSKYYEDEFVTLYHGDCREVTEWLAADVLVTDPPYGDTNLTWDTWPTGWIGALSRCLPGESSMWVFGSMRMHMDHRAEFTDWTYAQEIIWEKHNGSSFHADRFRRVHEIAMHWYRGQWSSVYKNPQFTADATARAVRRKTRPAHTGNINGSAYVSEDGGPRLMRSVLQVRSMHGKAIHPTEKPLGILEPIISYTCPAGGVVLDPFAGSGSTLLAARNLGRKSIGVELEERYCELIAKRLERTPLSMFEMADRTWGTD